MFIEQIHLGTRRALDNPDVGTIILHRPANVEGLTISASAVAAKDARKSYDKAPKATDIEQVKQQPSGSGKGTRAESEKDGSGTAVS